MSSGFRFKLVLLQPAFHLSSQGNFASRRNLSRQVCTVNNKAKHRNDYDPFDLFLQITPTHPVTHFPLQKKTMKNTPVKHLAQKLFPLEGRGGGGTYLYSSYKGVPPPAKEYSQLFLLRPHYRESIIAGLSIKRL